MSTNQATRTVRGVPSRVELLNNGFNILKLFSQQHGLMADGVDGHFMYDGIDQRTKLHFVSLYGDKLAPSVEDLEDVDVIFFDIPDVGCRYNTYL